MAQRLLVKVTHGPEALERFNQGITVAATALASGMSVSLWLTGDATWFVVPGRAEGWELPHAASFAQLRDALLSGAEHVTVCGQCAARRDLAPEQLMDGADIRGAAAFVEEAMAEGTQALVY